MPCSRCRECHDRGDKFCIYCGEILSYPRSGCDKCQECIQNGDTYCRYCGKRLVPFPDGTCDRCRESRARGDIFCRYCGRRLKDDENPLMFIGFIVGMVTVALLISILLFEYCVALWGIPQVLPNISNYGSTLILVTPWIIDIATFDGVLSQIYYILLIIAITLVIGTLLYKAAGPCRDLFNGDTKKIRETALFEVPVLFASLYICEFVFVLILTAMGVSVDSLPDRDTWIWMYELLEASVWEEVITRILLIGLPMVIIGLAYKKEGKSSWKYLLGGFGFNRTVIILIFISAFIFGAGHLNNWGWWKFFPTFAFGLIAGYLFSKYGVYATIAMHFMTDYMSAESWLLGTESPVACALLIMMVSIACIPYVFIYVRKGVLALRDLFTQSNGLK